MIENSYVTIESDGKRVTVNYFEDGEVREGPATFPARYPSMAGICAYIETQFNHRKMTISEAAKVQGFLGSPWPSGELKFKWAKPETPDA
jgi:hypothetical protein